MADQPDTSSAHLLRHTVATLAYRAGKALRGAPPEFEQFRVAPDTRTPVEILAHIGDLLDWAAALADGRNHWHSSQPLPWDAEVERFFLALTNLDQRLASGPPLAAEMQRLFSGPIADALTHTGQISLLRRIAGSPVKGENYFKAEIATGRVGKDQAEPVREFD